MIITEKQEKLIKEIDKFSELIYINGFLVLPHSLSAKSIYKGSIRLN